MKVKIFITILGVVATSMAFAQSLQKQYYDNTLNLGGDVVIKSSEIARSNNDEISKTFEIETPADGTYYLDAWLSAPLTPEGYPEYKVNVNGIILKSSFKPKTSNWESITLTDLENSVSTIKLKKGLNTIALVGTNFEVPNVEHIKLSTSALNTGISNKKYKAYIESIKDNELDLSTKLMEIPADSIVTYGVIPGTGTNGQNYVYQLSMPVPYTAHISIIIMQMILLI